MFYVEFIHYFFRLFKLHLFVRYSKSITNFTDADHTSIMFYPIATQFRVNCQTMGGTKYEISMNKRFMKEEYPELSSCSFEGIWFFVQSNENKEKYFCMDLDRIDLKSPTICYKKA